MQSPDELPTPTSDRPRAGAGRHLRAAALYFGLVFAVGFVLGAIRVPFLVPRLGVRAAELVEMPFMLVATILAAGFVVRRARGTISPRGWIAVGGVALALLVGAELVVGVVLAERGLGEYLASRDPVSGSVYLGLVLLFAAMPWLRRALR
jgi:hypothetical protein